MSYALHVVSHSLSVLSEVPEGGSWDVTIYDYNQWENHRITPAMARGGPGTCFVGQG